MKPKKRSAGFILTILCTLTLMVACRTGTSPTNQTASQANKPLTLRETPTETTTPGAAGTGTPTSGTMQYVGQISSENAWIGLSSTGKRMVAFVTDGSKEHKVTFAQWFRGSVTNNSVDTTAQAKGGTDRLQATMSGNTATGTVTLAGGKSIPFTANAVPASDKLAGLYRSDNTVKGQHYVGGWIVAPQAGAAGTGTPSATATETTTPSATATETTTPSATATETTTPSATATETTTPSATATGTTTPSATGALPQAGAILNEQNYNVLPAPQLTQDDINAKQITVPNLANFKLVPCQQNLC